MSLRAPGLSFSAHLGKGLADAVGILQRTLLNVPKRNNSISFLAQANSSLSKGTDDALGLRLSSIDIAVSTLTEAEPEGGWWRVFAS